MTTFLADAPLIVALLPLPITVAVAVIDGRRRIIPNRLNLALFGFGLAVSAGRAPDAVIQAVAQGIGAACLAFGFLWALRAAHARLRGRIGLGLGDVKFIAAATPWIGLAGLPWMILAASTLALAAIAVAALGGRRIEATTRLPFGPFLALGLHAALLAEALRGMT